MKRWTLTLIIMTATALPAHIASQAPSGQAIFEQALTKERVDGNLPDAIRLYERVVAEFSTDRALAARALVQIGSCYEKLGRDEAGRAYERLIRDFADQTDSVAQARARLVALAHTAPADAGGAGPTVRALPQVDALDDVQALSPDGTKAAFIKYDTGQNLAIYDFASRQTTLVTHFDWTTNWVAGAAWSPDGRRVAFMQAAFRPDLPYELRVATLDGRSEVIFRNDANPGKAVIPGGWLPDGSAVVVGLVRADNTFSIGFVPAGGGPFTALRSSIKWAAGSPALPSVSPDGRFIAFAEGSPGTRDIFVINRDGQTAHRITEHPADDHRPVWSPDGSRLVFLSNRFGEAALWTVAVKNGEVAGDPVRVKGEMQDVTLLGWTKRGLFYSQFVRTDDIFTVAAEPASGEPHGRARQLPFPRTGRNVSPIWSPDGKYLAFASASPAEPNRRTVVLLPASGGESREFPIPTSQYSNGAVPYDLRWFGNGSGFGFSGLDERGQPTLFRLTLATGEWKTFPLPIKTWTRIEWNGDGSRYLYARHDAGIDEPSIVEHDLQTDRERVVYRGRKGDVFRALQVSPNRRKLAFKFGNDSTAARQAVVVVDLESGDSRVVLDETGGASADTAISFGNPTWSPDGGMLLITRTVNRVTDLRLIPVGGGDVRRVPLGAELTRMTSASTGLANSPISSLVWSPDGTSLAFVLSAGRSDTWLIENPGAIVRPGGTPVR